MQLCLCWFASKKSSPTAFFAKTHYILFPRNFWVWVLKLIQNNFFCSSFKSFATRLFREFGCHRILILASNFKLRGINFVQIYWARLSNPSAPALFSCRQNSERCPQYFWEIVCSDLFARLVVQKVQILVLQQPLLALSNNRSVSDSFKFFSFFSI